MRNPEPSLHELALNRFFLDYVVSSDPLDRGQGFLEFLPNLYANASKDSCLRATVSAIALGNFAGRFQVAKAKAEAVESYGIALRDINSAIKDPEKARLDETVLSVYLISLTEVRPWPLYSSTF